MAEGDSRRALPWPFRRLLRLAVRPPAPEQDVDEEMRFHLELSVERLVKSGMTPEAARQEALRRFGDVANYRDTCVELSRRREQEVGRARRWGALVQDVRYGVRGLLRTPGFTLVAVLTLALGIGANTAIFGVVRGVLLRELPYPAPERLVQLWQRAPETPRGVFSFPDFEDWRTQSKSLESAGAYFYAEGRTGVDLLGDGEPQRLSAAYVSDGFFQTLGSAPLLGRPFQAQDHVPGQADVVVLSHGLWQRRFGGAQDVVGRSVTLEGKPHTVLGVMPRGFDFPSPATEVWLPVAWLTQDSVPWQQRGSRWLMGVGRLKPGVTVDSARAELEGVSRALEAEHPASNARFVGATVVPLHEAMVGEVKTSLLVLLGAVAFILLIACANLANLLLARGTVRAQELAVRTALGASPGRLMRQLLTESLLLAVAGGLLGLVVAVLGAEGLVQLAAGRLPRASEVRLDGAVLAFTLGLSAATGVLFGLLPALRASSPSLQPLLKGASPGQGAGGGRRLRGGLVVVEVALAVVLASGAGLAARSLSHLLSTDMGFDPQGVSVVHFSIGSAHDNERTAYYQRVLEAVRALPGVESVGAAKTLPGQSDVEMIRLAVPGKPDELMRVNIQHISRDYFRTLHIPVKAGRDFTDDDREGKQSRFVVVVNEAFVRRYGLEGDPVEQTLTLGGDPVTIVGVVGDTRQAGPSEPVEPMLYVHVLQNSRSSVNLMVRGRGDPMRVAADVQKAVWSVDPNQTINRVTTLEQVMREGVARPRLLAVLMGLFAALGLLLGAVGIYGVLAYTVSQRRREIGVRLALGATPGDVLRMVMGGGLRLVGAGVALGLAGALALARLMESVLYGVRAHDPLTFACVVAGLLAVAVLASWLPARRATRVPPAVTLRAE
ncbi:ABC transporter permease [Hyalangium rubrum]|uniref:ABC transporter permease n=1 Tax=Hyalangium rubrum TaxID=3103134 RepID=A0ABU5HI43_9BACT|nr:ABC transporter permease [Hyalangium sp. s54d21]MDY7232483.1 ABC transporter permease [Hyalangium sp. s54d21]